MTPERLLGSFDFFFSATIGFMQICWQYKTLKKDIKLFLWCEFLHSFSVKPFCGLLEDTVKMATGPELPSGKRSSVHTVYFCYTVNIWFQQVHSACSWLWIMFCILFPLNKSLRNVWNVNCSFLVVEQIDSKVLFVQVTLHGAFGSSATK